MRSQGQERGVGGSGGSGGRQWGWGAGGGRYCRNLGCCGNNPRLLKRSQGHVVGGEERDLMTLAPGELKYLVVEDVDDDPRDANSMLKDDLTLIAGPGDDGMWQRELTKFLQNEAKEVQEHSVARVHDWLHS
ncbi:hypothetical protein L208DRAFT_476833 [Tricholoma matsutake]|nr:hypothetical protein L208DRAFT_476833 [Tricholoma matsutake 945]